MEDQLFSYHVDTFHSEGNAILILGIGNYLMGDEGVGIHFIKNLNPDEFPGNISFIDGGTGGFTLIPYIESHKTVIIVDATMDKQKPGTISLLQPKFSQDFPISLSGHNFGLKDMVDILTMMNKMPEIFLFTISIDSMKPMYLELSPEVEAAIPLVTKKILALVQKIKENNCNKENLLLL